MLRCGADSCPKENSAVWDGADFCVLCYAVQCGSVKAVQNRTAPCPHSREYLIVRP